MRRVVEGAPRKKRYAVVSAAGDVDSYLPKTIVAHKSRQRASSDDERNPRSLSRASAGSGRLEKHIGTAWSRWKTVRQS